MLCQLQQHKPPVRARSVQHLDCRIQGSPAGLEGLALPSLHVRVVEVAVLEERLQLLLQMPLKMQMGSSSRTELHGEVGHNANMNKVLLASRDLAVGGEPRRLFAELFVNKRTLLPFWKLTAWLMF